MERSSPARVSGKTTREVTLLGVTYTLSEPERVGGYAMQEELILARRLDGIAMAIRACNQLPPNRHAAVWEGCALAASRGIASQDEWAAFEASLWRPAFMFWQALDKKHKGNKTMVDGVTWAIEIINSISSDDFTVLMGNIALVSQEKALGESSGSNDPQATQVTDTPSLVGT
jgi:hypothetical protein